MLGQFHSPASAPVLVVSRRLPVGPELLGLWLGRAARRRRSAARRAGLLPLGICTPLNSNDALSTPPGPIDRLTAVNHELLYGAGHKADIKTARLMRASRKRAHYRAGRAGRAGGTGD